MAVLDCGYTNTVCGEGWMQCFLETLSDDELSKVKVDKSSTAFKFGNGKTYVSQRKMRISTYICGKQSVLVTDVIDLDISLLLSKKDMGK